MQETPQPAQEPGDRRDLQQILELRSEHSRPIFQWLEKEHPERGVFVVSGGLGVGKSDFLDALVADLKRNPPRDNLYTGLISFNRTSSHDPTWSFAELLHLATEDYLAEAGPDETRNVLGAFALQFGSPEQVNHLQEAEDDSDFFDRLRGFGATPGDDLLSFYLKLFQNSLDSFDPQPLSRAMNRPTAISPPQRVQGFGSHLVQLIGEGGENRPYEGPVFTLVVDDLENARQDQVGYLLHLGSRLPRCFRLICCLSQLPDRQEEQQNFSKRFNPLFKQLAGDNWVNLELEHQACALHLEQDRVDHEYYTDTYQELSPDAKIVLESLVWAPFAPRATKGQLEVLAALDEPSLDAALTELFDNDLLIERDLGISLVHPWLAERFQQFLAQEQDLDVTAEQREERQQQFQKASEHFTGEIAVRLAESVDRENRVLEDPYLLHNLVVPPTSANLVPDILEETLPALGWYYFHRGESAISASLLSRLDEGADKKLLSPPAQTVNFCRGVLASCQQTLGNLQRAEELLDQFLDYAEQIGDREAEAAALYRQGTMYLEHNRTSEAREPLEEALRSYEEQDDAAGQARVLGNLGNYWQIEEQPQKAVEAFQRSADLSQREEDVPTEINARLNLGVVELERENYEDAQEELSRAQQLAENTGDAHREALCGMYLGILARREGRNEDALDLLSQARNTFVSLGDHHNYVIAAQNLVDLLIERGEMEEAENFAEEAVQIAEQVEHPALSNLQKKLADIRAINQGQRPFGEA